MPVSARLAPKRTREARIEARVSIEQKKTWERAAAINGLSLTDFLKAAMQSASVEAIRNNSAIFLNERASDAFVQALLNPPVPNAAAKLAARRYKEWAAR
jgi:uncharacterized protein (DUF1778 family)